MSTDRQWTERFWAKVDTPENLDECWVWTGALDDSKYGKFRLPDGSVSGVHIISWELANDRKVPTGWHVDHLCRVRQCLNPEHLEPVPASENTDRGTSFSAKNSRKTQCPRGHEYTDENIRWHNNRRECITCIRARDKERRVAKRQERSDNFGYEIE